MKSKMFLKVFIAICLCAILALTFTACKDKQVFAESSDFESYPDDWNNFNTNGDLVIPNTTSGNTTGAGGTNDNGNLEDDTPSDDPYANYDDGEIDPNGSGGDNSSSEPDTPSIFEPSSSESPQANTNQGPFVALN